MIDDLDKSLKELLQPMEDDYGVQEISFATPDDQFGPSLPAINLFLYDVRENNDLRSNEWGTAWNNDQPLGQRLPTARVDCSYLVTAWAGDIKEEHLVLGEVMGLLLRHPTLPKDKLRGSLKNQELPLPTTALQPGRLQSLGEFWQALGGKPKAAFDYTVTIAMPTRVVQSEKPVGRVEERQLTVGDKERLEKQLAERSGDDRGSDWSAKDFGFADTKTDVFKESVEMITPTLDRKRRGKGQE